MHTVYPANFDVTLAGESELGLGTVVLGAIDHDVIDRICDYTGVMKVIAVVPVCRPATLPAPVSRRKELGACVHRDRLGTPVT